ncbi:MOSC domain protein [Rhodobacteraceae bacterium THAF1]|nr:MOSC domain protein [Palleronia sp. THAF1]VDC21801.1 MOSC domain protein [Rhodobacteraceae bacterium THAF1]
MQRMLERHAQSGRIEWIGLRPARREALDAVESAVVSLDGLDGDHGRAGKRAVTLIQAEHLPVIAALLGRDAVTAQDLRRNLVVSGINLAAFRKGALQVGSAVLCIEGPCPPCSRMEETFGPGGYSAVRGHGGWYASVVTPGRVAIGEAVRAPDVDGQRVAGTDDMKSAQSEPE